MADLDRAIRCDDCGYMSDIGVLDVPTTDQLSRVLQQATAAALVVAIRSTSGEHTPDVVARAIDALEAAGFDHDAKSLAHDVVSLPLDAAIERVRRLRRELTSHGKQGFLHRIISVVMSDESITPAQRNALVAIGSALDMAPPHVNGILAVAVMNANA